MGTTHRQFIQDASRIVLSTPVLTSCFPSAQEKEEESKTNFLLIMADDLGFSDIGCYGSEIETTNIDRLASEGTRLTHSYNAGRCCPTRASLLTSLYPHQAGVGDMVGTENPPGHGN